MADGKTRCNKQCTVSSASNHTEDDDEEKEKKKTAGVRMRTNNNNNNTTMGKSLKVWFGMLLFLALMIVTMILVFVHTANNLIKRSTSTVFKTKRPEYQGDKNNHKMWYCNTKNNDDDCCSNLFSKNTPELFRSLNTNLSYNGL